MSNVDNHIVKLESSHEDYPSGRQTAYDDDDRFEYLKNEEQVSMLRHDNVQPASGRIIDNNNALPKNTSSANTNTTNSNPDTRCWELAYYRPYFDIDTITELGRQRKALLPFTDELFFGPNEKPDLYGPFWIVATLGFLMAAMSNLSRYLYDKQTDPSQWNSDIRKISEAFSFLYSGLVIIPGVTFFVLRSWNENPSLIMLVSLYGYSLVSYVPTCMMCALPFELGKWLGILASFALSLLFLTKNIYSPLSEEKKKKPGYYVVGWLGICQLTLSAVLKFYFFKY